MKVFRVLARAEACRLLNNTDGAIAVIAALTLSAMFLAAGVALDFSQAASVRTKMQAAADSAALAAAATQLSTAERTQIGKKVFAENVDPSSFATNPTVTVNMPGNAKAVTVNASGTVATSFMRVAGFHIMNVSVTSTAALQPVDAEVAMVLDVSGSMRANMGSETRMDAMRRAAHNLVDTVRGANVGSSPVKFGIVPFHVNVNIGTDQAAHVTGTDNAPFAGAAWAGCVFARSMPYDASDIYDGSDTAPTGKWQAYIWPPMPNRYNQCQNPSDGTNSGYASVQSNSAGVYRSLTTGPNYNCVRHPILPLTSNTRTVHDKINELTSESNMGTLVAPGISWGVRVLSPGEPFTEGDAYRDDLRKIIIVLTDGEQTTEAEYQSDSCHTQTNTTTPFSFGPAQFKLAGSVLSDRGPDDLLTPYGFIRDSDPFGTAPSSWTQVRNDLHNASLEACRQAKAAVASGRPIEIFSVAVSNSAGPGTKVYDLLTQCASKPENFFYAADNAALQKAFEDIAKEILNVRLTH